MKTDFFDTIFLRQVEISTVIGVHLHERKAPQSILIDLEVGVNTAQAARTDALVATVDYSALYNYLLDYVPKTRFQLLETLAADLSEHLMEHFSLPWLRLTITKKPADMPKAAGAGITIERTSLLHK